MNWQASYWMSSGYTLAVSHMLQHLKDYLNNESPNHKNMENGESNKHETLFAFFPEVLNFCLCATCTTPRRKSMLPSHHL